MSVAVPVMALTPCRRPVQATILAERPTRTLIVDSEALTTDFLLSIEHPHNIG